MKIFFTKKTKGEFLFISEFSAKSWSLIKFECVNIFVPARCFNFFMFCINIETDLQRPPIKFLYYFFFSNVFLSEWIWLACWKAFLPLSKNNFHSQLFHLQLRGRRCWLEQQLLLVFLFCVFIFSVWPSGRCAGLKSPSPNYFKVLFSFLSS